ncbi:MAG: sigma-70 family RNA polymerase sigma factor [Chthoniobacteraceae bacterium]
MAANDATDVATLLERYERPLVRFAMSIAGDLDSARDVVQETFIRYVRDESAPRGPGSQDHIEAWLFTVCRHRAIDHRRKHSRIIPMPLLIERAAETPDPAAVAEGHDTEGALLRLLDGLTENQRDVIRLKFQNDLSYREISEITGLSETNVGFLLHTGLKKLRDLVRAAPDFADLANRHTA